jgi:hypothetical protein
MCDWADPRGRQEERARWKLDRRQTRPNAVSPGRHRAALAHGPWAASRQVCGQSSPRQNHRRAPWTVRRRAACRTPVGSSLCDPDRGRCTRRVRQRLWRQWRRGRQDTTSPTGRVQLHQMRHEQQRRRSRQDLSVINSMNAIGRRMVSGIPMARRCPYLELGLPRADTSETEQLRIDREHAVRAPPA